MPQIALQIQNSDRSPLYDVRYHARRCPSGQRVRSDVSRTIYFGSVTGPSSLFRATTWQPSLRSGSPSRSALEAGPPSPFGLRRDSLRPLRARRLVGLGRLELPTSRLSSARSNQLSYKPQTLLPMEGSGTCSRALGSRQCIAQALSPWRVFVREERET